MTKVLLIYDPFYANIKKVAMAISRGLEAGKVSVDTIPSEDINVDKLHDYDLIAIGCVNSYDGISKQLKSFVNTMNSFNMEGKYGFVFEIKAEGMHAKSAGKRINRYLKNMKMKMIHPIIIELIKNKDGTIKNKIFVNMEQVGLNISLKLDNDKHKFLNKPKILKYSKLIIFGGGPIFFFIRAVQLAVLGGDTFSTLNPIGSWILLSMEITFSGIAGTLALVSLLFELCHKKELKFLIKIKAQNLYLIIGVSSYMLHFIRVTIWLSIIL